MTTLDQLRHRSCRACDGTTPPLEAATVDALLALLPGWQEKGGEIAKTFSFKNYYHTTAFVNAVVWLSHREDHHPDITFGYKTCTIRYTTHAIGGLSENDFICAAKVEALLA